MGLETKVGLGGTWRDLETEVGLGGTWWDLVGAALKNLPQNDDEHLKVGRNSIGRDKKLESKSHHQVAC